jgi:hypothetical protein
MLYAGLDLSRTRLDFHLLNDEGVTVDVGVAPPDADGLRGLRERLDRVRSTNHHLPGSSSWLRALVADAWRSTVSSARSPASRVQRTE